jgi:SAM-dependent methyltransferase
VNGTRAASDLLDAARVGPGDRVLDVGRRNDIGRLPFDGASFDVVVCRQRLQLLPDRPLALSEMRRVLVDDGRLALSVGGRIERSAAFAALAGSLERHAGVRVAATVRWLFSLADPEDLRASLACAGYVDIRIDTDEETTVIPSVADLLRFVPRSEAQGFPLGLTEHTKGVVVAELDRELAPWIGASGLELTMDVHTAVATR